MNKFKTGDLVDYCFGNLHKQFESYNGSVFKILSDLKVDPLTKRNRYSALLIKNSKGPWPDNYISNFDEECFCEHKKRKNPTYAEIMAKL